MSLEILGTESNEIILSKQQKIKALISLCGCAAKLRLHADRFLHYAESRFSHMSHVMKNRFMSHEINKDTDQPVYQNILISLSFTKVRFQASPVFRMRL